MGQWDMHKRELTTGWYSQKHRGDVPMDALVVESARALHLLNTRLKLVMAMHRCAMCADVTACIAARRRFAARTGFGRISR